MSTNIGTVTYGDLTVLRAFDINKCGKGNLNVENDIIVKGDIFLNENINLRNELNEIYKRVTILEAYLSNLIKK